jgi:hypothetical protein
MGASASAFGLGCLTSQARVISIDDFNSHPGQVFKGSHQHALMWMERITHRLLDVVTVVPADAIDFASQLPKRVYAVHIDLEYNYKIVWDAFVAWWPKLSSKGHLFFYDANADIELVIDEIAERYPLDRLAGAGSIRHFRKVL